MNVRHVVRFYSFVPAVGRKPGMVRCVAIGESPSFTIYSRRRKVFAATPTVTSSDDSHGAECDEDGCRCEKVSMIRAAKGKRRRKQAGGGSRLGRSTQGGKKRGRAPPSVRPSATNRRTAAKGGSGTQPKTQGASRPIVFEAAPAAVARRPVRWTEEMQEVMPGGRVPVVSSAVSAATLATHLHHQLQYEFGVGGNLMRSAFAQAPLQGSSRACRAAQQTPHLWGEWEAQQGGAGGATARLAVMPRDRASSGHTINNGTPNPAMVPAAATAFMSVSAANALSPRTMPAPAPGSVRRDAGHGTGFANQGWTNQMLAMASVALLGGSGRMAAGGDARHVAVPSVPEMALQVQVRREDEGGRRPSGLFCRGCAAVHEWCAAVVCCRVCCSA